MPDIDDILAEYEKPIDYSTMVDTIGNKYPDVSKNVVTSLIERESSGNPMANVDTATRHGMARGIGQFIDETAKRFIPDWQGPEDSLNPEKNIAGIFNYLSHLQKKTGSTKGALKLYLGSGEADKFGTRPEDYADQILKAAGESSGQQERSTAPNIDDILDEYSIDDILAEYETPEAEPAAEQQSAQPMGPELPPDKEMRPLVPYDPEKFEAVQDKEKIFSAPDFEEQITESGAQSPLRPEPPTPKTSALTPVLAGLASIARVPGAVMNWAIDDLKKAKKAHEKGGASREVPVTFLDAYSSFQQTSPQAAFANKKAFVEKLKVPEEERQKTIQELDNMIKTLAKSVDEMDAQVPDWVTAEVAKAQNGELNPLKNPGEALITWATLLADQAGLWGANIAGPGAGAGIAIASMREEFKDNAKQNGLTEEDIENYTDDVAFKAGMLEYVGEVATLGLGKKVPGIKKLTKPLSNFLGKTVLGKLASTVGSAATEGLTEYSQQAIFNHYLGKIARDKLTAEGVPEEEIAQRLKDKFKNDPILKSRDFIIGAGIGGGMAGFRNVGEAIGENITESKTAREKSERDIIANAQMEDRIKLEKGLQQKPVQGPSEVVAPSPTGEQQVIEPDPAAPVEPEGFDQEVIDQVNEPEVDPEVTPEKELWTFNVGGRKDKRVTVESEAQRLIDKDLEQGKSPRSEEEAMDDAYELTKDRISGVESVVHFNSDVDKIQAQEPFETEGVRHYHLHGDEVAFVGAWVDEDGNQQSIVAKADIPNFAAFNDTPGVGHEFTNDLNAKLQNMMHDVIKNDPNFAAATTNAERVKIFNDNLVTLKESLDNIEIALPNGNKVNIGLNIGIGRTPKYAEDALNQVSDKVGRNSIFVDTDTKNDYNINDTKGRDLTAQYYEAGLRSTKLEARHAEQTQSLVQGEESQGLSDSDGSSLEGTAGQEQDAGQPAPKTDESLEEQPEPPAVPKKPTPQKPPPPTKKDFGYPSDVLVGMFGGADKTSPQFSKEFEKLSREEKFQAISDERRAIKDQIEENDTMHKNSDDLRRLRRKLLNEMGKYSDAKKSAVKTKKDQLDKYAMTGKPSAEPMIPVHEGVVAFVSKDEIVKDPSILNNYITHKFTRAELRSAINSIQLGKPGNLAAKEIRLEIGEYIQSGTHPTQVLEAIKREAEIEEDVGFEEELPKRKPGLFSERGGTAQKTTRLEPEGNQNDPAMRVQAKLDRQDEAVRRKFMPTMRQKIRDAIDFAGKVFVDVNYFSKRKLRDTVEGMRTIAELIATRSSSGEAKAQYDEFIEKITEYLPHRLEPMFNRFIEMRRIIEVESLKGEDIKSTEGINTEEAQAYLDGLKKQLTPAEYQALKRSADEYYKALNSQLKQLAAEGIITKDLYNKLTTEQVHYSPRVFLNHVDPAHSTLDKKGKKITVTDSGIKRLDQGSEDAMVNNFRLLLADSVSRTQNRIHRNRASKALFEFAQANPNNDAGVVVEQPIGREISVDDALGIAGELLGLKTALEQKMKEPLSPSRRAGL